MIIRAPAVQASCACVAGALSAVFISDGSAPAVVALRLIPFTVRVDRIAANGSSQQHLSCRIHDKSLQGRTAQNGR